ncbi:serine/threonine-protein kinase mTOR-like, partial [Scleropages formosus]|uniref:serine/threonine-protein kinase mTOR-like n=1 Tax=Scleropages formosus TaxID=113540 RepID=UPI0010FA70D0
MAFRQNRTKHSSLLQYLDLLESLGEWQLSLQGINESTIPKDLSKTLLLYTVPAIQGFFRSISLSRGNNLQDTLRVLTLPFDYGHWPEVNEALVEGIKTIQIDTWLQVIPQLIARIDTPRALVGRLIHQLLTDIGHYHPQALIYPLTVASKSTTTARHNAANKILKNMCEHCNTLVQQAIMVGGQGHRHGT